MSKNESNFAFNIDILTNSINRAEIAVNPGGKGPVKKGLITRVVQAGKWNIDKG